MVKRENSLNEKILKAINFLKDRVEIDYVVLFGSYADGNSHEYSDIDLAIISKDFERKSWEEKASLASEIKIKCDLDIEIHPFTLADFKEARPTNFLGYILKNGKVYVEDKKLVA